jgi:hypothetical protein
MISEKTNGKIGSKIELIHSNAMISLISGFSFYEMQLGE